MSVVAMPQNDTGICFICIVMTSTIECYIFNYEKKIDTLNCNLFNLYYFT